MADTKVSALTAVSAVATTDEIPVNQGGVSKKVTVSQLGSFIGTRTETGNTSITTPAAGFAADTYLAGSACVIPATSGLGSLKAGTVYRCRVYVSKTAAGTVAPVFTVRVGTLATTGDTAAVAVTFGAQTAIADTGLFEVFATFRSVGSGTAAVVQGIGVLQHQLATTGLSTTATNSFFSVTGAGFNSSAATFVGLSINGGTSAAWTIPMVQAELFNLA